MIASVRERLARLWHRLISPATSCKDAEDRQQSSLLAALTIALFWVGIITLSIWVLANP